jgi:hypothetical protein
VTWKASLNGGNRTQAGSLCYINTVASELQVHGGSCQDGSERSLGSPEDQSSIGFQPVFFCPERCFPTIRRSTRVLYKAQWLNPGLSPVATFGAKTARSDFLQMSKLHRHFMPGYYQPVPPGQKPFSHRSVSELS